MSSNSRKGSLTIPLSVIEKSKEMIVQGQSGRKPGETLQVNEQVSIETWRINNTDRIYFSFLNFNRANGTINVLMGR